MHGPVLRPVLRPVTSFARFSPRGIAGLAAWYRIGTGTTVAAGKVTAQADLSGNGHTLSNAGSLTYTAADAKAGGAPSVSGGAATGTGLTVGHAVPSVGAARTILAVGYSIDAVGGNLVDFGGGANSISCLDLYAGGNNYVAADNSNNGHIGATNRVVANELFALVWTITPGALPVFRKGRTKYAVTSTPGNPSAEAGSSLELMSRHNRGLQGWTGGLCEVAIFGRALPDADVDSLLLNYVHQRYPGITL
jgi:hypothetical protein